MLNRLSEEAPERMLRDEVVESIAASRFNLDGWIVRTPARVECVSDADIVATCGGAVVATGVVETVERLSDESALRWKVQGELCPRFYLFVPEGSEDTAAELIDRHQVVCGGLRCYSIGEDGLDVRSAHFSNGRSPEDSHNWWIDLGRG